jgi:hypothetical protein
MRFLVKLVAPTALAALALAFAGCGTESSGSGADTNPEGAGVGLSVQEALLVGLDAPQLVSGYLIEEGGTLKLCDSLQESEPPGCGEPSLTVKGDMLADLPRGELVDVNGQVSGTTITPTPA